ncbi:hypothetical protein [Pseudochrobactrum sp. XF203]|uniref:hypothetical protein n=1 Tax=Pseudochrobactrum sp. XF203 TaxID=2879116 RepID=UPI001CE26044|nr:hypothetical protein [Pseudochrobactrum sp. XF203]UCA47033.1 hypothetical protein LDL70_07485 [Pseudochrobactrum sp. XF203]
MTEKTFCNVLEEMRDNHINHIRKLLELKQYGITIGAPAFEDIINREQSAIDNLQKSINWLKEQGAC